MLLWGLQPRRTVNGELRVMGRLWARRVGKMRIMESRIDVIFRKLNNLLLGLGMRRGWRKGGWYGSNRIWDIGELGVIAKVRK